MIEIRRMDHVALRVADVEEAAPRWAIQFGLTERERSAEGRARLACHFEPYSLELIPGGEPGFDHAAFELRRHCSLDDARRQLDRSGVAWEDADEGLMTADPEGNRIQLVPFRPREDRTPPHMRRTSTLQAFHPRKLGHVNFVTGAIEELTRFYTDVLGMRITDWIGDEATDSEPRRLEGVWLHVAADHHVVALVDKGYSQFHHLAFEHPDVGQLRIAFDHLGRHGRWLAWGPVRHGMAQNLCGYVRITEEPCLVELYCDMEVLEPDHEPRFFADDPFSSNTWGGLPPRSYFRFDAAAVESERLQLEAQGRPLPPL